jgi:hypothetical protein
MSEKRKFSRINFAGKCSLNEDISGTMKIWQTKVIDISLKGALVQRPDFWDYKEDSPVQLNLALEGSDIVLECAGVICHQEEKQLGIKFLTLSLDSISHLKRLIQLNLADEESLHREISQLINISKE